MKSGERADEFYVGKEALVCGVSVASHRPIALRHEPGLAEQLCRAA